MSFFVQSTPSPRPKTAVVHTISRALALVLAAMAIVQLLTLPAFIRTVGDFWLPISPVSVQLLVALLIVGEFAALPFLLRLRLSPAMRVVSMVMGWLVLAAWLVLQIWVNTTINVIANNGMLGGVVLPVGWYALFCIFALGVLAAWSSWGMWPFRRRRRAYKTPSIKKKVSK